MKTLRKLLLDASLGSCIATCDRRFWFKVMLGNALLGLVTTRPRLVYYT